MDFTFSEDQVAVAGLAARIFDGLGGVERVAAVEASDDRFDRVLWSELARANLIGLALPETAGGSGLGVIESCLVLEAQGRVVAPIPLLWTQVAAATIAAFGDSETLGGWASRAADGSAVLAFALAEGGIGDPLRPGVVATPTSGGWLLTGTKPVVAGGHVADAVLVPARVAGSPDLVLMLVNPGTPGIRGTRAEATDRSILTTLQFEQAEVLDGDVVAGPGSAAAALSFAYLRALTGLCALQLGVAEEALARAAAYTSGRHQFGKPLSSFQSTAARAADAYIDVEAMRATLWQAAWRLDRGLDAAAEVEVAGWWAAEAGQRVVHATQHLHGGVGADIGYPIHRYFLWGKQLAETLGGSSTRLARIGRTLAEEAR